MAICIVWGKCHYKPKRITETASGKRYWSNATASACHLVIPCFSSANNNPSCKPGKGFVKMYSLPQRVCVSGAALDGYHDHHWYYDDRAMRGCSTNLWIASATPSSSLLDTTWSAACFTFAPTSEGGDWYERQTSRLGGRQTCEGGGGLCQTLAACKQGSIDNN